MLARSVWSPGKTMLANVIGTLKATCGAVMSAAAVHNAMKGQSLPQSGTEGLLGQHGISSSMVDAIGSAAICLPTDAFRPAGIAITGRAIGTKTKPAMARNSKAQPMTRRILI